MPIRLILKNLYTYQKNNVLQRIINYFFNCLPSFCSTNHSITYEIIPHNEMKNYLEEIACLRVEVFQEYPYFYKGDMKTEMQYLQIYQIPNSVAVLAKSGSQIIGVVTGTALENLPKAYLDPFKERNFKTSSIYYLGEVILKKPYRKKGIGAQLYTAFEKHIRSMGLYSEIALCEIEQPENDPKRPMEYLPLKAFWKKRGYIQRKDLSKVPISWKEIGTNSEIQHLMVFSTKILN